MTALHYACFWGYEQICDDLIRAGALVNICNRRGLTPIVILKIRFVFNEKIQDVCRPQSREAIYQIALELGQNPGQKIPYAGDGWRAGTAKTLRSRDATWYNFYFLAFGN